MKEYAIIQIAGKQHLVSVGDTLIVDQIDAKAAETITITDVLLVNDGKKITVGAPLVEKAGVKCTVVSHGKGEKIDVFKYKSKSRYRRHQGHRQHQTTLTVVSI